MASFSWLSFPGRSSRRTKVERHRPRLEALEDRCLMAASLAVTDVSVWEGAGDTVSAVFTVTLSAPADQAVTVDFRTADGTARAGHDYQTAAGTLTFAPGETSKTVAVAVVGDSRKEHDETFFVNLSGAVNAHIGDGQGIGAIWNDDFETDSDRFNCRKDGLCR